MEKSMILEVIGDTVINRIVDFLIEGRGLDYSKKDIAEGCEISRPTLYKILPRLVKEGVVKPTRAIGKVQLYALNEQNEKIKVLLKMEELLLKKSFEEVGAGKIKVLA
jgi:DNA-binding transcriptional ArsR family regulator